MIKREVTGMAVLIMYPKESKKFLDTSIFIVEFLVGRYFLIKHVKIILSNNRTVWYEIIECCVYFSVLFNF